MPKSRVQMPRKRMKPVNPEATFQAVVSILSNPEAANPD